MDVFMSIVSTVLSYFIFMREPFKKNTYIRIIFTSVIARMTSTIAMNTLSVIQISIDTESNVSLQ